MGFNSWPSSRPVLRWKNGNVVMSLALCFSLLNSLGLSVSPLYFEEQQVH